MSIILAGVSHHNTPLSVRERLYFPETHMDEWLDRLAGYSGLEERLILSTCNRVEVYSAAENFDQGLDAIHRFFLESRDIGADELNAHLYVHREAEATRHLFTVASSLDSMVVGEPQILGQVKEAYRVAQASGHAGKALTNLFSRAFRVAKKIREQTPIGESPVSVSSVAVDLAKRIFGFLAGKNVLLLGAGEMGEAAARHLKASGADNLHVANRTLARAQELAAKLKGSTVSFRQSGRSAHRRRYRDRIDGLTRFHTGQADSCLCTRANAATRPFSSSTSLRAQERRARSERPGRRLSLRRGRSAVRRGGQHCGAARKSPATRTKSSKARCKTYLARQQAEELRHTFAAIRFFAESMRQEEVQKTFHRLPELGEEGRDALDAMTKALVNKLLHHPFAVLRQMSEERRGGHFGRIRPEALRRGARERCRLIRSIDRRTGLKNERHTAPRHAGAARWRARRTGGGGRAVESAEP